MEIKKKQWLEYTLELKGTKGSKKLTEQYVKALEKDKEQKIGLFAFGDVTIGTNENDVIVLQGVIHAYTSQGCKGAFADLKYVIKKMYWDCTKIIAWYVAEGESIF